MQAAVICKRCFLCLLLFFVQSCKTLVAPATAVTEQSGYHGNVIAQCGLWSLLTWQQAGSSQHHIFKGLGVLQHGQRKLSCIAVLLAQALPYVLLVFTSRDTVEPSVRQDKMVTFTHAEKELGKRSQRLDVTVMDRCCRYTACLHT